MALAMWAAARPRSAPRRAPPREEGRRPACVRRACPPPPPRWLHGLIDTYGGVQPDTDEVHVPAGRKSDVKVWYDEEVKGGNSDLLPVSTRQFNRVWLENLPHLKCRAFLRSVLLVHEF